MKMGFKGNRTGSVHANRTGSHMCIKRKRGRFSLFLFSLYLSSFILEREALASLQFFGLLLRQEVGSGAVAGEPQRLRHRAGMQKLFFFVFLWLSTCSLLLIPFSPSKCSNPKPKPLDLERERERKQITFVVFDSRPIRVCWVCVSLVCCVGSYGFRSLLS